MYKSAVRATKMEMSVKDGAPADGLSRLHVRRGRLLIGGHGTVRRNGEQET